MSTNRSNKPDARNVTTGRWKKGRSGNPAGRPPGSRNKSSVFVEGLLNEACEELVQKVINMAKGGDMTAMRLCLERISPPRKDRPVELPLPQINDAKDASIAVATILSAVGEGRITPGEAESLIHMVETHAKIMENADLSRRIAKLEEIAASLDKPTARSPEPRPSGPSDPQQQNRYRRTETQ